MKIMHVAIIGLLLGGCGVSDNKPRTVTPPNDTIQKEVVKRVEGITLKQVETGRVEVLVNSGANKISAISMKIEGANPMVITGFETNKTSFNSDLSNKLVGSTWEVSVAAMRSTSELLSGNVSVGTIKYSGTGLLKVKSVKLVGPNASGTPIATDLIDKELLVK